jgi:hypothetical protein
MLFFPSRPCLNLSTRRFLLALCATLPAFSETDETTTLDPVVVHGRSADLVGEALSAAQGEIGAAELASRPFLRRGELLEVVPGVVITQHSGSGKANQYFLRGFNLDHGTDFAVTVDGMPVNMRTHAHGQGYSDLNFIIPELIQGISYQKGLSFSENGDFSAAGAAQFHLTSSLPRGFAKLEIGEDDYVRGVVADTIVNGENAATTVGAEASYANGPWTNPEHSRRYNLFARHAWTRADTDYAVTVLGYHGAWNSTDQIPLRAVDAGTLGRYDAVDPTDGGDSDRASISFTRTTREADATTQINAYAVFSHLDLYSNFSYFLDDSVNGDQFNQRENRGILGGTVHRTWNTTLAGRELKLTTGLDARDDLIDVSLRKTRDRELLDVVRSDDVHEASAGLFTKAELQIAPWFRTFLGLRGDLYYFDVDSENTPNSGNKTAAIASPKLGLVFGPWAKTELYLNGGYGFHSNDARGVTDASHPATPLARAKSAEFGVRTAAIPGLVSTASLWLLDLDSELVFVGDAGNTEATGSTRRYGVEFANFYRLNNWLTLDADIAFTHGRYRENTGDGTYIPNSLDTVVTAGVVIDLPAGWTAALRARYFGPQPLVEDNSVTAPSSLTYNARLGWRGRDWEIALDILNLFDHDNYDIAYFYESQLPGEALPVADIHFHPAEPRTFRLNITRRF